MAKVSLTIAGQEVELDPEKLSIGEGCDLEDIFGSTFEQFEVALASGSLKAARALVLVLGKRVEPDLRLADVDKIDLAQLFAEQAAEKEAKDDSPDVPSPTPPASGRPSKKSA